MDHAKNYKFKQATRKGNILASELSSVPGSAYFMEQVEQLLGNLRLSDSESDWLDDGIKKVTADESSSGNVILYKVRIKIYSLILYMTLVHPSVSWQNVFMINYKMT